jgi:hypothetical protein
MKTALTGLLVSVLLVACSGSDSPSSPTPATTASATPSTSTSPEPESPTPSASAAGFCEDRGSIGDVYRLVREGAVPYRQAAASVTALSKFIRADIASASTDVGARKIRQLVLYLNTLRLAILGAAQNYPEDFAVKQFTQGLLDRVQVIAVELDCPPA